MNPNELHPLKRMQLARVYDALARLLPVEGRDYKVDFDMSTPQVRLTLSGLTPMGVDWLKHVNAVLPQEIQRT